MAIEQTETFEEIIASHREFLRDQARRRLKRRRDFKAHPFAYVMRRPTTENEVRREMRHLGTR